MSEKKISLKMNVVQLKLNKSVVRIGIKHYDVFIR